MSAIPKRREKEAVSQPVANSSCYDDSAVGIIASRRSEDLIIGFCGLIGCGVKAASDAFQEKLKELGYEICRLRVSELMMDVFPEGKGVKEKISGPYKRYADLQDLGDKLRGKYGKHILSECVINEIRVLKEMAKEKGGVRKRAYLIDQLKNPGEVELLRMVYQHNFYLIGVIRDEQERKRNLRDESISDRDVDELIHRDRKSSENDGQQTQKAILDADFFIKNNQSHRRNLQNKAGRFIKLIHGVNGLTPTKDEEGMYAAFAASLQSACLSRQVGAAIFNSLGEPLAVGKNDVPKFGGGLYSSDDKHQDHRCVHKGGKCYNDIRKIAIRRKMEDILRESGVSEDSVEKIASKLYEETPVASLIEYSRSIHAEMDALISLSRSASLISKGASIYTTTFPCHNCARHIVASGIERVIYIEPYDKSLALDLHDDAITKNKELGKVIFEPFEGVSPRRYQKFFFSSYERKDKAGMAVVSVLSENEHVDVQYLDSYQDFETKIASRFGEKLNLEAK